MATLGSGVLEARPPSRTLAGRFELDWRGGLAVAALLAGATGLASASTMTRGPVTAGQGLAVMGLGLLVGLATGVLTGRARAIVPVGLAHVVAIELGRIDAIGPTLDMVRFDTMFGFMAFAFGRGLHGLLLLLPMLFGTALGIRLRPGGLPRGLPVGTVVLGLLAGGLAALVAIPASTPPVLDAAGKPIPGSIAELTRVELNGTEQMVMIRAASPDNPILLYLSGGPGQSDLGYSRPISSAWDDDFVFVDWDQRGNGNSYPAIEPVSGMTVDHAIADTIALTEYLTERFDERKVYLMGESWGSLLGVLAIQQRPDLYHAWIGSGQMVNIRETDRRIYEDLMAYAASSGNAELAAALEGFGPPPYRDFPMTNAMIWTYYDYLYEDYTPSDTYVRLITEAGVGFYGLLASEYDLMNKANAVRGLFDTFYVLYPDIYDHDFRTEAASLEVPVWILDGAAELDGRRNLTLEWFEMLDAPEKHLVTYENAAHSVAFEQVEAVHRLLVDDIVPATYGE